MRARAQRQPPARLPGSCLSLSLLGKGFFSRAKSCHHPLFFPFPPLILGRSLFQAKSCNSHQNPNSSGVQSLKLNTDPASLRDGSEGKLQLLLQPECGHSWFWGGQGPMGWIWDVPCGAGGLQPHPRGQEAPPEHRTSQRTSRDLCWRSCTSRRSRLQQPKEEEMDTVRQPRASHLMFGQFLITISTSIEPKKLCFAWFSMHRCNAGQENPAPVAILPPCRSPRCSQREGWDPWDQAALG